MNRISFKLVSLLLGMTALTVVSSTESANAQTPSTNSVYESPAPTAAPMEVDAPVGTTVATFDQLTANTTPPVESSAPIYAPIQTTEPAPTSVTTTDSLGTHLTSTLIPEQTAVEPNNQQGNSPNFNPEQADDQKLQASAIESNQPTSPEATTAVNGSNPLPGTVSTSAANLTADTEPSSESEASSEQGDTTVAQELENIEPGRPTRGGRSYVGIGGAVGLSGSTGIGQGGFLINSKIGLTRAISFRPSVIIGDSADFLLPLTYDFFLESRDPFQPVPFAPFVGGGVAFSTDDGNNVGFLITGGADFPLSRQFVGNATVNAGFFGDTTSVGISLGVGYLFSGF